MEFATKLLDDNACEIRMLATYLLVQPAVENAKALEILETRVATDDNWRVKEVLAKAFDHYCESIGYERSMHDWSM